MKRSFRRESIMLIFNRIHENSRVDDIIIMQLCCQNCGLRDCLKCKIRRNSFLKNTLINCRDTAVGYRRVIDHHFWYFIFHCMFSVLRMTMQFTLNALYVATETNNYITIQSVQSLLAYVYHCIFGYRFMHWQTLHPMRKTFILPTLSSSTVNAHIFEGACLTERRTDRQIKTDRETASNTPIYGTKFTIYNLQYQTVECTSAKNSFRLTDSQIKWQMIRQRETECTQ